jgi:hypothetical protein
MDANGQPAPGQTRLECPRAHLHQVKRRLRRAPVDFCKGIRLHQKFQHFYLCRHTLNPEILFAVHVPLRTMATAQTLAKKFSEEIPLGTPVEFCLACRV